MTCDARIRPFRPMNEIELHCSINEPHGRHSGILYNYAYQGSETSISWDEDDRRTFHGNWPGVCPGCLLPLGHRGSHAPND